LHRAGEIASYDIDNGERVWWFPYLTSGTSTPVINDNLIYVGTWHNYSEADQRSNFPRYHDFQRLLDDFDANGDSFIQKSELPDSIYFYVRPEIMGMESADGGLKQFFGLVDENSDNKIIKSEWTAIVDWIKADFYKEAGMIALNPENNGELSLENVIWRELDKVPEVPSPIFYNDLVYMCKNGGILTCMDALNGNVYYRERIGASGAFFASPVATYNFIYVLSGNGIITVIEADKNLKITSQSDLKEKIYATPAISGNTMYVRTTEHLYAFSNK
jgi:hypothetical protein